MKTEATVDTISFTTSPIDIDIDIDNDIGVPSPAAVEACFNHDSFWSAIKSLKKFRGLKSLSINLPFPNQLLGGVVVNNRYLFKWKLKLSNNTLNPFVFLSPDSICYGNTNNGNEKDEVGEDVELMKKEASIAFKCLWDATVRFIMLFDLIEAFPLLEKVSISDSAKMGKVSLSGSKLDGIRNLKHCSENSCCWVSHCYIPLLELPVSGYLMKGVTLVIVGWNDDSLVNVDFDGDFENKEEAAYNEAVMKILNKHRGLIKTARFMKSVSPLNCDENEEEEQYFELTEKKINITLKCLWDSIMRVIMLYGLIETFPLLEKVSIMDSAKMGTVSFGASKIAQRRFWLLSPFGTIDQKLIHLKDMCWVSWCYIPLFELPRSGYLMKGVTLIILHTNNDSHVNIDFDDDFEYKEKIDYNEVVMKIFNKHKGLIKTERVV